MKPSAWIFTAAVWVLIAIGCATPGTDTGEQPPVEGTVTPGRLSVVSLNDPVQAVVIEEGASLQGARNEWVSFTLQASGISASDRRVTMLRFTKLQHPDGHAIGAERFEVQQVLPLPVDLNRAGFVRHTGLSAQARRLPRALLPVAMDSGGVVNLSALRDPAQPTNPASRAGQGNQPVLLWVDLKLDPETEPGTYAGHVELLETGNDRPVGIVPVSLTVHDFVLPDERHLVMVSQVKWETLQRLWPDRFEAITPRLVNRSDERYAPAVRTMDDLVTLAQRHRAQVVFPRLQPTVKWPPGASPQIDWSDFDSVVTPWLNGTLFDDRTPLGYWPLPAVDYLDRYDRGSQMQYWQLAAGHFDQREWLRISAVFLESPANQRVTGTAAYALSRRAAEILAAHPRIRVTVPLEEDQVQFADGGEQTQGMVEPWMAGRLMTAAPGLVFSTPVRNWPNGVDRPARWMRTDLPGLVPYIGAGGDERDVRLWAWLGFLRQASVILWNNALPTTDSPNVPADPNELIWFYPGSWFGMDKPVPTLQLKWLRQAQQDYEYLYVARQRRQTINAMLMARLIAKQVELQPNQVPDPVYGMLSGTADRNAWNDVRGLLAKTILLRGPGGESADPDKEKEVNNQTIWWTRPLEKPFLLGRSVAWGFPAEKKGNWLDIAMGIDIYNASDVKPEDNSLTWAALPAGWEVYPQPLTVPSLSTYHVRRYNLQARFDLEQISDASRRVLEMQFRHGYTGETTPLRLVLPVAASDRREGQLKLDGSLEDWTTNEAIQDGPMVRMLSRPAIQHQALEWAKTPSQVFTGWAEENFYLAFRLEGVKTDMRTAKNFVDYQFRRAWGEDLAEVLIQPVYADNTTGSVLHLVCKPSGHWIEKKPADARIADAWQPLEGVGIRYVSTVDDHGVWRGEVAVPWKAILDNLDRRPKILRFNFTQHNHETGESATWAGPVDFGRDESLMGVLYLEDTRPQR